jgi:hypothetical protein
MEKKRIISVLGQRKNIERQTFNRKYDVSPIFPFANLTAVAPSTEEIFDFESRNRATGKYLPFNSLRILNNSNVDISVSINQKRDRAIVVPAGTIQPIDNTIAPAISSLLITNLDGTNNIEIGEVRLMISKDNVTTDLLAKKVFKLIARGV